MQSDVVDPGQLDLELQNLTRVRERDLQTYTYTAPPLYALAHFFSTRDTDYCLSVSALAVLSVCSPWTFVGDLDALSSSQLPSSHP